MLRDWLSETSAVFKRNHFNVFISILKKCPDIQIHDEVYQLILKKIGYYAKAAFTPTGRVSKLAYSETHFKIDLKELNSVINLIPVSEKPVFSSTVGSPTFFETKSGEEKKSGASLKFSP